jgi:hypothetical protein
MVASRRAKSPDSRQNEKIASATSRTKIDGIMRY